jgi:cell division protein FtsL
MATARVSPTSRRDEVRPLRRDEQEQERHLRVVPRQQGRTFRLTPKTGVGLTVGLFTALFGVAVSHALLIEGQIELDRLDEQVAEEQARYERLRLDVAELESPERILSAAEDLGMVAPDDVVWHTPDQATSPGAEGESAAGGATGTGPGSDSTGTSYTEVKPYLGTNP